MNSDFSCFCSLSAQERDLVISDRVLQSIKQSVASQDKTHKDDKLSSRYFLQAKLRVDENDLAPGSMIVPFARIGGGE